MTVQLNTQCVGTSRLRATVTGLTPGTVRWETTGGVINVIDGQNADIVFSGIGSVNEYIVTAIASGRDDIRGTVRVRVIAGTCTGGTTTTSLQVNPSQVTVSVPGGTCAPGSITITANQPVTWTFNNGSFSHGAMTSTSVTITGVSAGSGSVTATTSTGSSVTIPVTVCQSQAVVPTCSLTASPSNINSGQSSTLFWNSTNATSWSTSWGATITQATGQMVVNPTSTTTYTLACNGPGGTSTSQATVTVSTTTPTPTPSCVPSSQQIDYTPRGGTINVGQNITLTAQNYGTCVPYWYSLQPSRGLKESIAESGVFEPRITGGGTIINVGGVDYYAGPTAVLRAIASGQVTICVQINLTNTQPSKCYVWTIN